MFAQYLASSYLFLQHLLCNTMQSLVIYSSFTCPFLSMNQLSSCASVKSGVKGRLGERFFSGRRAWIWAEMNDDLFGGYSR
jgi:hypothetical protein